MSTMSVQRLLSHKIVEVTTSYLIICDNVATKNRLGFLWFEVSAKDLKLGSEIQYFAKRVRHLYAAQELCIIPQKI